MGLEFSVGMTWESPAAMKNLGMDDRGRKTSTQIGEVHGRREAGERDRKSSWKYSRKIRVMAQKSGRLRQGISNVRCCREVKPDMDLLGHRVWHRRPLTFSLRCAVVGL